VKSQLRRLHQRIDKLRAGGNDCVPDWLTAVADQKDLVEWQPILRSPGGFEYAARKSEFIHKMRAKHPNMPLTVEEEIEAYVEYMRSDEAVCRVIWGARTTRPAPQNTAKS
jgi:hypothetical protein